MYQETIPLLYTAAVLLKKQKFIDMITDLCYIKIKWKSFPVSQELSGSNTWKFWHFAIIFTVSKTIKTGGSRKVRTE